MPRIALPFPTMPGKTEADVRSIAELLKADPEGWAESRRRGGCTLERAYMQQTPMGIFVVAYLETAGPIELALGSPGQSDLPIDRAFTAAAREIHGVDLTQPPAGPPPEVVGDWVDPDVTVRKRGMAFCAPMNPGMEDRGRAWAARTYTSPEFAANRRALGLSRELITVVQTPQGPICAVYVEGDDPVAANRSHAASTDPFDTAFKAELAVLFPPFVDFNQPVPGVTEIFDSETMPVAIA